MQASLANRCNRDIPPLALSKSPTDESSAQQPEVVSYMENAKMTPGGRNVALTSWVYNQLGAC